MGGRVFQRHVRQRSREGCSALKTPALVPVNCRQASQPIELIAGPGRNYHDAVWYAGVARWCFLLQAQQCWEFRYLRSARVPGGVLASEKNDTIPEGYARMLNVYASENIKYQSVYRVGGKVSPIHRGGRVRLSNKAIATCLYPQLS